MSLFNSNAPCSPCGRENLRIARIRTNTDLRSGLRVAAAEEQGDCAMHASRARKAFVCQECGDAMQRVSDVPVLASLVGQAVHGCAGCGHVLLVCERDPHEWNAGWVPFGSSEISCVSLV
jgi:hypothetical protein